jgi:hypothetical protein
MHDRTTNSPVRKPKPMGMKAETLQFTVSIPELKLRFTNAVAMRKRRHRDRNALDLQRFDGPDWPRDRLLRALTVEWLTDTEALDNVKVKVAIALQSASLTMGGSRRPCALPFFADRLIVERAALLYRS